SLAEIKEQCDRLISDIDNATETDILNVTEYFINNATKLTVVSEDVSSNLYANEAAQMELETLISEDVSSNLYANEAALDTEQETALATATKSELIASTAGSLGIELSTADIENIADNFDAGSDDFTQTLEQVKGAIIAYVQHKIASNNQKIVNTINEICQVASDGFEENSQTLTNGLKQLNQQLVQQSADFKSKLAGTLSRFKLPEAS
ncbi:MAG: hypothetical protein ACKPJF_28655, partial [Dolichospermum sp.]